MNKKILATQSYVTSQAYITGTLGVNVNMNAKYLNFTNRQISVNGNKIIYFYPNASTLCIALSDIDACMVLWLGSQNVLSSSDFMVLE